MGRVWLQVASDFVRAFFEQNPISTLAVLVMRDGKAEPLTEASCNARQHLAAIERLEAEGGRGVVSLQNALELARECLRAVPSFTSREVLLLWATRGAPPHAVHLPLGSLLTPCTVRGAQVLLLSSSPSTSDPGDILQTVAGAYARTCMHACKWQLHCIHACMMT